VTRNTAILCSLLAATLVLGLAAWGGVFASSPLRGEEEPAAQVGGPLLRSELPLVAEPLRKGPVLQGPDEISLDEDVLEYSPVQVRVLGASGAPLPGAYVLLRETAPGGKALGRAQATDANGEVDLGGHVLDGSLKVEFFRTSPYREKGGAIWDPLPPLGGGPSERLVDDPEIVYRARTGLTWRVFVVDAESGGALRGVRIRDKHTRVREAAEWQTAPQTWLSASPIDRLGYWGFEIEPPQGWVSWEPESVPATISPYATAIEQIHPLRREIAMTVTARDTNGDRLEAIASNLQIAGSVPRAWTWTSEGSGHLRVRGVPFLRDEIVQIAVSRMNGAGLQILHATIPDHPDDGIDLAAVLLDTPPENAPIGIGGGAGHSFRSRRPHLTRHTHANALHIRVLRRDGSPAFDASVSVPGKTARTDAQGRVTFEHLAPGSVPVTVHQAGLLPMQQSARVPERGEAQVELREGMGGTLEVEIVDGDGAPLPFAALSLKTASRLPWIDMNGTTQRIDPYTDHLGRRTLHHVEPGPLEVSARWASRRGTKKNVQIQEGGSAILRLVLVRPQPPR
jgi:hypothetical protein